MLYIVHCFDDPKKSNDRIEYYDLHKKHVANASNDGVNLLIGGPLLEHTNVIGSFLLVQADNIAKVRDFVEKDPFKRNKVWLKIDINEFEQRSGALKVEDRFIKDTTSM